MQEQILSKLYEVSDLLAVASCDGKPLVGSSTYSELADRLGSLIDAVEYFVD